MKFLIGIFKKNFFFFSQYVPLGSLYQVLHEGSGLVVDASKAIQFAIDVAKVSFKKHFYE